MRSQVTLTNAKQVTLRFCYAPSTSKRNKFVYNSEIRFLFSNWLCCDSTQDTSDTFECFQKTDEMFERKNTLPYDVIGFWSHSDGIYMHTERHRQADRYTNKQQLNARRYTQQNSWNSIQCMSAYSRVRADRATNVQLKSSVRCGACVRVSEWNIWQWMQIY